MAILSICIPTYNRARDLRDCLDSVIKAVAGRWDDVELLVCDNASTDNTAEVVREYQQRMPLRYRRNEANVGGERNFRIAAREASAEYVWIFGDDDQICEGAIAEILGYIRQGYDLIVANFSKWSKDMDVLLTPRAFPWEKARVFDNANEVLSELGIHVGYISAVIARKEVLLHAPDSEYEKFVRDCFPQAYSLYAGLAGQCRAVCAPTPLFRNRGENYARVKNRALGAWFNHAFIEGPANIFEALGNKGYSRSATRAAKDEVLRDFVMRGLLSKGADGTSDRNNALKMLFRHYKGCWRFWFICLPILLAPSAVLRGVRNAYRSRQYARNSNAGFQHYYARRDMEGRLSELLAMARDEDEMRHVPAGSARYRALLREAEKLIGNYCARWQKTPEQVQHEIPELALLRQLAGDASAFAAVPGPKSQRSDSE